MAKEQDEGKKGEYKNSGIAKIEWGNSNWGEMYDAEAYIADGWPL